jgi:hypothetical protein
MDTMLRQRQKQRWNSALSARSVGEVGELGLRSRPLLPKSFAPALWSNQRQRERRGSMAFLLPFAFAFATNGIHYGYHVAAKAKAKVEQRALFQQQSPLFAKPSRGRATRFSPGPTPQLRKELGRESPPRWPGALFQRHRAPRDSLQRDSLLSCSSRFPFGQTKGEGDERSKQQKGARSDTQPFYPFLLVGENLLGPRRRWNKGLSSRGLRGARWPLFERALCKAIEPQLRNENLVALPLDGRGRPSSPFFPFGNGRTEHCSSNQEILSNERSEEGTLSKKSQEHPTNKKKTVPFARLLAVLLFRSLLLLSSPSMALQRGGSFQSHRAPRRPLEERPAYEAPLSCWNRELGRESRCSGTEQTKRFSPGLSCWNRERALKKGLRGPFAFGCCPLPVPANSKRPKGLVGVSLRANKGLSKRGLLAERGAS